MTTHTFVQIYFAGQAKPLFPYYVDDTDLDFDGLAEAVHRGLQKHFFSHLFSHCEPKDLSFYHPNSGVPHNPTTGDGRFEGYFAVSGVPSTIESPIHGVVFASPSPQPAVPLLAQPTPPPQAEQPLTPYNAKAIEFVSTRDSLATVDELWGSGTTEAFEGAFARLIREKPHGHIRHVLRELELWKKEEKLGNSERRWTTVLESKTNYSKENIKRDVLGLSSNAEDAHCFPDSKVCIRPYGVFGQAVVGLFKGNRIEELPDKKLFGAARISTGRANIRGRKEAVIAVLNHITDSSKYSLKSLAVNKVRAFPSHQIDFDVNPQYLILPLVTVEFARKWTPGSEYWAAIVANSRSLYNKFVYELPTDDDFLVRYANETDTVVNRSGDRLLRDGTALLEEVVKALAENATLELNGDQVTLEDLLDTADVSLNDKESTATMMREVRESLQNGRVNVPHLLTLNGMGKKVLMVKFLNDHMDYKVPDPLIVAMKAAINWYYMTFDKKLLPACGPPVDEEQAKIEQLNEELHEAVTQEALRASSLEKLAKSRLDGNTTSICIFDDEDEIGSTTSSYLYLYDELENPPTPSAQPSPARVSMLPGEAKSGSSTTSSGQPIPALVSLSAGEAKAGSAAMSKGESKTPCVSL